MAVSQSEQLDNCISAIKLSLKITEQNYKPNEFEEEILRTFVGFGGIKALLYPLNIEWNTISSISQVDLKLESKIKEFYAFITSTFGDETDKVWDSIKESILTSFYTPSEVAEQQIRKVRANNSNSIKNILEPSAGNGIYVDAFINNFPHASITAIEKDFVSALILKARFYDNEKVKVYNKGFEEVIFQEKFDLISSNIPFGNFKILYKDYENKITDKIHNFFFYHASNLLNEGGALSFLTSTGVFNSGSNLYLREKLAKQLEFIDITTLPENVFNDSGTIVTSHIVQAIKNENRRSHDIDIKNSEFVLTTKIDEGEFQGVQINTHIFNNFNKSFLAHPKLATNPYGNLELNYRLPTTETYALLQDKIYSFPQLNITQESFDLTNENLQFQKFPIDTYDISSYNLEDELKTLRDSELINQEDLRTYRALGIITANYKAKTYPIATISKILVFDENSAPSKRYIIDYYLDNFIGKTGPILLRGKDFKEQFLNFTSKLVEIAEHQNLEVNIFTKGNDQDSQAFEEYFSNQFNQPELKSSYQISFPNFAYHKELFPGALVLNSKNEPSIISDILDDDGSLIYELTKVNSSDNDVRLLQNYLFIYDSYNQLLGSDESQREYFRNRLNTQYDNFVHSYGFINENLKTITRYDSNFIQIVKTLENKGEFVDNQIDLFSTESKQLWTKSDIFFSEVQENTIFTPLLAIAKSFNVKGKIDIEYISQITNLSIDEVLKELQNKIIKNPLTHNYELKSIFFSGNLKNKINEIAALNDISNESILAELTSVLPPEIPFEAINIQFGSRWIPQNYIETFINKYFEQDFSTVYSSNIDSFFVEPFGYKRSSKYSSFEYSCISGRYIRPEDIIQNAFYDIYPIVTFTDSDKVTHTDDEATKYYKREIVKIRKEFCNYIAQLPLDDKDSLTTLYNDKFNNLVIPDFDSDILDFSEFNLEAAGIPEIYIHQKRAPWKIINNEGGIVDHEVGLGKTFSIVATAYFGKTLGTFKKPIILGLKANVPDLALAYRTLLPGANILFASEKEFTTKEREVFLNKIRNNHYDAIIMSHEQFGKIPQSEDIEFKLVKQELKDVEDNLTAAEGKDISKKQLKGLEIRKKNLTSRLSILIEKLRNNKDQNVLNFSDLGIDHIIVDESHRFKNLMFQTKHNRVAGLGNSEGSQRANNLLTAIRTIQQNTRTNEFGATFFSGTPISNSITELYLLQKYLTPVTLQERGIMNFDAWCSNFAEKSIEFETNMVNQIISKERFRYFVNLPELSQMYKYMTDVMTGEMANIDRPNKNQFLLLNDQTPLQKRFYFKLSRFLQTKDQSNLKLDEPLKVDSDSPAISLVAMNLAFKASLDMRLISSQYKDEPQSKINFTVKELLSRYKKFDEQKITQIVFLDISTPKKKYTFEQLQENYHNNHFTSIYDDIKYKLIKSGIPEKEIAFIQDYKTENKKKILNEKMNKGDIRFLIGGTENAGTGLNVQERLGFINHLSIPWKPSELDQRDGRGFRKGNWIAKHFMNNEIDIAISATKNTLDNYKVDLNKNKQNFINQLKGSAIGLQVSRKLDEGAMDENAGMGLAELQAQLTGDDSLLKKFKIDNKIKDLEQDKMFILSRNKESEQRIEACQHKIQQLSAAKELFLNDLLTLNNNVKYDKDGNRENKPIYKGLDPNATPEEIHQHIIKVHDDVEKLSIYNIKPVAELYGFELYATNDAWEGVLFKVRNKENNTQHTYSINDSKMNLESMQSCVTFFIRSIDTIKNKIKNVDDNIERENEKIDSYRINSNNVFEHEDQLQAYIIESQELDDKIKNSNDTSSESYDKISINTADGNMEFKVISDINTLDKAVLKEHLGSENSSAGFFCPNYIKDIIKTTSTFETPGFGIIQTNFDAKSNLNLMKVFINDYDEMYISLSKSLNNINLVNINTYNDLLNDGHSNFFLKTNQDQFFCLGELANLASELENLPIVQYQDISFINISPDKIEQIISNIEKQCDIEVKIIDQDNPNNLLRKL